MLPYRIYRRLKFIRYKKKLLKKQKIAIKEQEKKEQREQLEHLREFRLSERKNRQIKQKAEREEARRLRIELKKEISLREKQAKEEWNALTLEDKKKQELAFLEEKKARKTARRQSIKTRRRNFSQLLSSFNYRNLKKRLIAFRDNAPYRRRFYLISFNSTVLFLLSYFFLFLFSQAITVMAAQFFDYPTIVYYYEIYFNIGQESWYHDSVKTIFSSGPIVVFVIGITFLIIYSKIRETAGAFKLFFLWGFLHAVNMLFGALLIGTLFETGVGHVISWMYIMDTGKVLYSIISIFLLVIAGIIATKQFLVSGNTYYNEMNHFNRKSFILAQVLMPYLIGNALLLLIRQPRFVFYDSFIALTLIITLIPVLTTYQTYHDLYFEEDEKKPGIAWKAMLVLAFLVLIFRGLLSIGLHISA
jgi:hypothetical protein